RAKGRIVLLRYGEPLSDGRTPLADFFRILLGRLGQPSSIAYRSEPACLSAFLAIAADLPH
ncbi:MAG TPA: hypothetical protein PLT27_08795, partial [Nitrospira sp.]|nr:hypothetical protein [Nitrospira sp.]